MYSCNILYKIYQTGSSSPCSNSRPSYIHSIRLRLKHSLLYPSHRSIAHSRARGPSNVWINGIPPRMNIKTKTPFRVKSPSYIRCGTIPLRLYRTSTEKTHEKSAVFVYSLSLFFFSSYFIIKVGLGVIFYFVDFCCIVQPLHSFFYI